jgi:hypothetical protein
MEIVITVLQNVYNGHKYADRLSGRAGCCPTGDEQVLQLYTHQVGFEVLTAVKYEDGCLLGYRPGDGGSKDL